MQVPVAGSSSLDFPFNDRVVTESPAGPEHVAVRVTKTKFRATPLRGSSVPKLASIFQLHRKQ